MRDCLDGYLIYGGVDRDRCIQTHQFVAEMSDVIFSDHDWQDLLFNRGSTMDEDKRPSGITDLRIKNRLARIVVVSLDHLTLMKTIATRPQVTGVRYTDVSDGVADASVSPGIELQAGEGYSYRGVEGLQRYWMEHPEETAVVDEYELALLKAMKEWNMKFLVGQMGRACGQFIPVDSGRTYELHVRLQDTMDKDVVGALNDAYFTRVKTFMRGAGVFYEQLSVVDFGSNFVLTQDEIDEQVINLMR